MTRQIFPNFKAPSHSCFSGEGGKGGRNPHFHFRVQALVSNFSRKCLGIKKMDTEK